MRSAQPTGARPTRGRLHFICPEDELAARNGRNKEVARPTAAPGQPLEIVGLLRTMSAALVSTASSPVALCWTGKDNDHVAPACASSLVLIVREAVVNAMRHAHPAGVPGQIQIEWRREAAGALVVEVSDDGVGLPEGFDTASDGGDGFRLMRAQARELGADLQLISTWLGLKVQLRIPLAACGSDESETEDVLTFERPTGGRSASVLTDSRYVGDLMQTLPAAIYTTDAAGRITFYNEAAANLWGCQPLLGASEFCGSWKLYWQDGRPMRHDECPMAMALREGKPIRGMEAIAERPDGTRVPFIPYPSPVHDKDGKLLGAINLLVDITERKQTEELVQRFAFIVESSHDAIVSKNLDGNFMSWNGGAERLFGHSAEEVIGRPVTILMPPERLDEEPVILARVSRGERIEQYDTVRLHKDGSPVEVSLSVSPVKDATGRIVGASEIVRDITEQKRSMAREALLASELQHRTKNLFSLIQSVIARSFVDKHTVKDVREAVFSRLRALAQTHVMLFEAEWEGADLGEIVRREMAPYGDRVTFEGPALVVTSRVAQNFTLALHELATNAAKYGALSNVEGQIRIGWVISQLDGRRNVAFRWQELGGPRVAPPAQKGFGSVVLEKIMADFCEQPPRIVYDENGIVYELKASLEAIAA